ncbi:hypothetical protein AB0C76_23965 [Kitasatospora sp. NPDC048722]|uniref:hypothetical protein n=1 Tax=Kitasatospora sp. NPDC048722 TaxID=3155639 RepID=UPI0033ED387F
MRDPGHRLLTLAALGSLQRVLAVRYRRPVNVPLAAATLLAFAGPVTGRAPA